MTSGDACQSELVVSRGKLRWPHDTANHTHRRAAQRLLFFMDGLAANTMRRYTSHLLAMLKAVSSEAVSARHIVSWEVLPGLPGDGPIPFHFHTGKPTPWTEGFVVRFRDDGDNEWVGNFQGRQDWTTKVVLWPQADSIVVLAMDNFYLVDARNPDNYVTLNSQLLVDDAMLDDEHKMLFVSAFATLYAYGRDRRLIWTQSGLGGYDAQLKACTNGLLTIEVEEELGGATRTLRLSANDGTIL